jgi:hypothetical protein
MGMGELNPAFLRLGAPGTESEISYEVTIN